MTLTPEGQRQMDAWKAHRRATWDGKQPLTDLGRERADHALITIGWQLWSCERKDADENALGGIVVAELPDLRTFDPDTGEITTERAWRIRNPYRSPETAERHSGNQVQHMTESELVADGVARPDRRKIAIMIRALGRYVGAGGEWFNRYELEAVADAARLAAALDR